MKQEFLTEASTDFLDRRLEKTESIPKKKRNFDC